LSQLRIGVDTGGTFTDCVYLKGHNLEILKIPSTPDDPGQAVLHAVSEIAAGERVEIRHGTTVGTNALLERKGARVCFLTTAGFEDTIEIGRQNRPALYDWFVEKEPPLAERSMRLGVEERTASDGTILKPLRSSEIDRVKQWVRDCRAESIALSFLFSFANPKNEAALATALRKAGCVVSASHEILPEFREYERGSTVLVNAYLAPRMRAYLGGLNRSLNRTRSTLHVMQSSGGIISARVAAQEPVRTILSGPAGGVVGAVAVARRCGFKKILTFDMGGTSTDVSLIDVDDGPNITNELHVGGMPVAVPMLDIHTVGAGGGSIAAFDRGGILAVGPQSTGADPGPICFGRGTVPTVTDANLVLGRLDANSFLGGAMQLDEARTRDHLARTKKAIPRIEAFAEGIINLANAHMVQALRKISIDRGHDPREFLLVSFGGAGPLHACALAQILRVPRVLIPVFPGALSAYGVLVSDFVRDYSRTVMKPVGHPSVERHFRSLERLAKNDMKAEGLKALSSRHADMHYVGQGYELRSSWGNQLVERFHRLHSRRYGYADPNRHVEIVNLRVRMIASTKPIEPPLHRSFNSDGKRAIVAENLVIHNGRRLRAPVYQRSSLRAGDRFAGPVVVTEYSATTFIPPGCRALVDKRLNLLIEVSAA